MPRGPTVTESRRDLATAVTSVLAAQAGAWAVRVHDVAATRDACASQRGGRGRADGLRRRDHADGPARLRAPRRVRARSAATARTSSSTSRSTSTPDSAAASDDVADTVHYGEAAEQIAAIVGGEPVDLLETLAQRIADALLAYDGVRMVARDRAQARRADRAAVRRCVGDDPAVPTRRGADRDEPPTGPGRLGPRSPSSGRHRAPAPVEAVVALGANLGDRAATLDAARRRPAPAAARRRGDGFGGGRVGRGQARRAGCRGAGVPERRRARDDPTRALGAAGLPARDRGRDTAGSGASAGAIARSTSTSSRTAT